MSSDHNCDECGKDCGETVLWWYKADDQWVCSECLPVEVMDNG